MTDFGLTEDMYGTNYYRQEKVASENEERLPIRWMAPESIENNLYSESTDVVSLQPGKCVVFIISIADAYLTHVCRSNSATKLFYILH